MTMFKELFALATSTTLTLTISADEKAGRMTINVIPSAKPGSGEPALASPLSLTASPEEFDAEFIDVLKRFRTARASLTEQMQVTERLLDAAKEATATKGRSAVAMASAKTASSPAARGAEDAGAEPETEEQEADSTPPAPSSASEPQSTEPQLFG